MANKDELEIALEEKRQIPPNRPNSAPIKTPLILAILALVLAFYAIFAHYQMNHESEDQKARLNQAIAALKEEQKTFQEQLAQEQSTQNETQERLKNQFEKLRQNLQTLSEQNLYQKQDWLLLKARYFLELAQVNAYWSRDQEATVALLQQADSVLAALSLQELFAVRQAIAQEITEIKALPKLDTPGLLAKLDAAQNAIANLTLKQPISSKENQSSNQAERQSSWKNQLKNSLSSLEKLVVIRHHNSSIEPLLSPMHQMILKDSIRLNLEQAQWAVLQMNPQVYELALNQALIGIKQTFDPEATTTTMLIEQLEQLSTEKLIKPSISLNKALPLLNRIIESKTSLEPDKGSKP